MSDAFGLWEASRALELAGQSANALAGYREVVERFGSDPRAEVQDAVVKCLFNIGVVLSYRGERDAAVAAFDDLLLQLGDSDVLAGRARELRATLASGGDTEFISAEAADADELIIRATRLGEAGQFDESIAVAEQVLNRFDDADYASLRLAVANALYNKAIALREQGRNDESVATLDEVQRRYGADTNPHMRARCAIALFNKAVVLRDCGRVDQAVVSMREVCARYGADEADRDIRQRVARALMIEAQLLGTTKPGEALETVDELQRRFAGNKGDQDDPVIVQALGQAMLARARATERLGRTDEALTVLDDVVATSADRPTVAAALGDRAELLLCEGQFDGAAAAYSELLARFGDDADPDVQDIVAAAHADAGFFLGLNRPRHRERLAAVQSTWYVAQLRNYLGLGVGVPVATGLAIVFGGRLVPAGSITRVVVGSLALAGFAVFALFWTARRSTHRLALVPPVVVGVLLLVDLLELASARGVRTLVVLPSVIAYALTSIALIALYLRLIRRDAREYGDVDARITERYGDQHRAAARVVLTHRRRGEPFTLYLRSFDIESLSLNSTDGLMLGERMTIRSSSDLSADLERRIAAALGDLMPIVGAANPTDTMSWYKAGVPKLELPHENWQDIMRDLIASAHRIVIALRSITPGVVYELELLVEQCAQDRVIIVLADGDDPLLEDLADFYRTTTPKALPLVRTEPPLSQFPCVLTEAELANADLG